MKPWQPPSVRVLNHHRQSPLESRTTKRTEKKWTHRIRRWMVPSESHLSEHVPQTKGSTLFVFDLQKEFRVRTSTVTQLRRRTLVHSLYVSVCLRPFPWCVPDFRTYIPVPPSRVIYVMWWLFLLFRQWLVFQFKIMGVCNTRKDSGPIDGRTAEEKGFNSSFYH